ncbi:pas domain s-box [Halosimplex carlsbadense 2-9-1]|uniref:Pas domain s-box n=1 Tax=Halosimplex carlsbadense 2-9-1 TaxID=797114 RepID=M0D0B9_9EURY|nr:PAS domain S-box protein [Halosimplex carlsbadense]ELZ27574.1 pas domain s-box [Halosimplex carlsbadense 2-9-1]
MNASGYRESLYEAFAGADDLDSQVADALALGTDYLSLDVGFLTRVDDGVQEIVQSVGDHDLIRTGETCPLDRAYCRRTVEVEGSLAVQHAGSSSLVSERALRTFEFGTYVGARIELDDGVYGTVCFADEPERDVPFSEAEQLFVELLAKLVGQSIERRDHERELRGRADRLAREKQRFEGIAENSFDVLFRVDPAGAFTYASAAVERVLGYDPDALVGAAITDHVHESSVEGAAAALSSVLDGEAVEQRELAFLDTDGNTVALEVNATPIRDGGEVVGAQGVGRDVSARKERERELRIKNRAMDEAEIGISLVDGTDPERPLVYVNEGFGRVTGYDPEELLGRNCRFLQGEATDPETVATLRAGIEAHEPVSTEIVNYRADGSPFWNRVQLYPIENDAGTVTHFLGFQDDVTERKRAERLRALLNRVLRHNLGNDITPFMAFGEMLRTGEHDVADLGARIEDSAERLVALSDKARDLEELARRDPVHERLDAAEIVSGAVDDARDRSRPATVETAVETDRDLCAGIELRRALAELVENALEHGPAGSEPRVEVAAVDDGDWVELTVTDDGPGIDAMESAVVEHGRETALEHGSGLGLWLVNWVVTRYGGSFQVGPADDGGTVARVRLPGIDEETPVDEVARPPTLLFR